MSLLERIEKAKKTAQKLVEDKKDSISKPAEKLRSAVLEKLPTEIESELLEYPDENLKRGILQGKIEELIINTGSEMEITLPKTEHEKIVEELLDEILGLGPIERFIKDAEVTEVMVNGCNHVYVEKHGKLYLTDVRFKDDSHVMRIIDKIVAPIGRRIDESSPYVDARLKDGSRVNAIIPPLALSGPTLTIRKFFKEPLTVHDLVRYGTWTEKMMNFLEACVKARLNIIVSGGTGSGKTTTLNILSSFIPGDERIVTIEDAAELQLRQEHVVSIEARPPNIEGRGEVTIRNIIKNVLRMRPDRIVVGEVRGGEAIDMLQAMNTGHDGSLTTAHANSPRELITRLETMVLMSGFELPAKAIREQISSAIEVIVHQNRLRDGSRKITNITEVMGMEGDVVVLQDIFVFEQQGVDADGKVKGILKPTGIKPKFMQKFDEQSIVLPNDIFA